MKRQSVAKGLRHIGLSMVVLLGALVLGLSMPGEALAMAGHSGHASMTAGLLDGAMPDSDAARSDATHAGIHGADLSYDDGGCDKGMMADCCVMTCCSATMPDLLPGAVRQFVIAARSSRPTVAGGRVILPLLEPPKRLS